MSDKIIKFTGITRLDIPAASILKGAREAKMTDVLVIGYDKDGEFYFVSSMADGGHALWLMENAKKRLLEVEV